MLIFIVYIFSAIQVALDLLIVNLPDLSDPPAVRTKPVTKLTEKELVWSIHLLVRSSHINSVAVSGHEVILRELEYKGFNVTVVALAATVTL